MKNVQIPHRPQLENRASIAATNVTVRVTSTAGLRIDAASWSAGRCAVANGVAACTAASLAANSTTPLDVRVTALTEGAQSYSISATAAEAERNSANNSSSVNFSVNRPASGGGGTATALLVSLLLGVIYKAARARLAPAARTGRIFKSARP